MNLLILIIKILSLFYQLVHTRLMRCFLRHLAQRLFSTDITPFYWIITLTTGKPFLRPQLLNWGVQNPTSRLSHTSICLYGLHNGWMGKKIIEFGVWICKNKSCQYTKSLTCSTQDSLDKQNKTFINCASSYCWNFSPS